jgi:hypothetical protein
MTAAAWQEGYELDHLKRLAAPFAAAHKRHVYGAFGLVKERDVAAALKAGQLLYAKDGETVVGAAIIKALANGSTHSDFAGRAIKIPGGSVLISAFAATTEGAADRLVNAALDKTGNAALWVEIFEEDAIAKGAMQRAGLDQQRPSLVYVATKVMAGSEIKGLYSSRARGELYADAAEDATLLVVEPGFLSAQDLADVRGELAAADWAQHYSGYNKGQTWTAFALRGYDAADPTFIIKPAEMSAKWKAENAPMLARYSEPTTAWPLFPKTTAIVERLGLKLDRVRFMKLAPGKGELTRHADITDRAAGLTPGAVARLHIPIITNPGVRFQAWDKHGVHMEHNFPEAALCYLDQRKPHAVVNGGPTERIHLVIDVLSAPSLRMKIAQAAAKATA